jgi:hypothetical protein
LSRVGFLSTLLLLKGASIVPILALVLEKKVKIRRDLLDLLQISCHYQNWLNFRTKTKKWDDIFSCLQMGNSQIKFDKLLVAKQGHLSLGGSKIQKI